MITDAVLDFFDAALLALIGLLPLVGDRPEWVDNLSDWIFSFNYFLPMSDIWGSIPFILLVLGALILWRVVRYFLPGG
jgi:hypothetical protein